MVSETSYFAPTRWMLGMFKQHQVVPAKTDAGFYCTLCGVYAVDYSSTVEHCRSNEHLTRISARPSGIWGEPGEGSSAASSGQAMGSSSWEPSRSSTSFQAADKDNLFGSMVLNTSLTKPAGLYENYDREADEAARVEEKKVQVLTAIPGIMQSPVQDEEELSLIEMAMSHPDRGVVLRGTSFWIADSGLTCVQTMSQHGVPLVKAKGKSMEPFIREAMTKYDRDGLFCYHVTSGGGVKEVLAMLLKALAALEAEGERRGIIADGRFPMFEHGSLLLFHNDHTDWKRMRCQRTYKAEAEWGYGKRPKLKNQNYWDDLEKIADIMSVLVKKPNALIGC
jgi:hypothetical protein